MKREILRRISFKTVVCFFVFYLSALIIQAQNGPGGVGNLDGNSSLKAWYNAGEGISHDEANKVLDWRNRVNISNLDLFASGNLRPDYMASARNGQSVVSFNGSNRLITAMNLNASYFPSNAATTFIVSVADNTRQNSTLMGTFPLQTQRFSAHLPWGRSYYFDIGSCCNPPSRINNSFGSANVYNIWAYQANAALGKSVYINNHNDNNVPGVATYSSHGSHKFQIGDAFRGDVAEVIIFNQRINTAQRNIITNYLSAKYAIALTAGDIYASATYCQEVIGIGKEADGDNTKAGMPGLKIQATGGFDNGDYLLAGHDGTINDAPVTTDLPAGVEQRWKRDWFLQKTGNLDATITFDIPEGITDGQYPKNVENYVLLYRSATGMDYSVVPVSSVAIGDIGEVVFQVNDANINNGYYTLGTTSRANSPVTGKSGTTWYSLRDGNWNEPTVWTTDPSGSQWTNPSNSYPHLISENVVVKAGRTVTMNVNDLECADLTVEGDLELGTSSGHAFRKIAGNGHILMAADNFPSGDATSFISKNQGEGTVVFHGGNYTINRKRTFYDVQVNLDNPANNLTLLNDFTVRGKLTIQRGGLKINDDASTAILHIDVDGNVDVQANGRIVTGHGNTRGSYSIGGTMPTIGNYHNIYHQFTIGGDFTNKGSVRFTNEAAPRYNQFTSLGAVTVRFDGEKDSKVSLYGTTDFYNLILQKGTDKTYILEVYADNADYFRLFGANNVGRSESSPFSAADPEVRKALWVYRGTLKLTGNIEIPTLSEGNTSGGNGDYAIGGKARFWLAGDGVKVYSTAVSRNQIPGFESTAVGVQGNSGNQAFSLMGELKVSGGFFGTRNSAGIVYWASSNAIVNIEKGEVDVAQFRSVLSSGGKASYIQSGGLMTVRGDQTQAGEVSSSYPLFGLSGENDVFYMSGGEIRIHDTSNATYDFYIPSSETNYNVTGGTVHFQLQGSTTLDCYSTANLWNVEISRLSGNRGARVDMHSDLKVANDLLINANAFLDHNGHDVSIGRNFSINASATKVGNNYGYLYDKNQPNTTTFNGTQNGVLYIGHPHDDVFEQYFWNVIIDKPANRRLLIDSDLQKSAFNVSADYHARVMLIQNDLIVNRGTLDQGEHSIRLFGPLTVNKEGKCGVYKHGTTHIDALIMFKDADIQINTEKGAELGNIKMNPQPKSEIITLTSDVKIGRISYWYGRINMGPYKLTVDYLHHESSTDRYLGAGGKASNKMFYGDGAASNGGLSLFVPGDTPANSDFVFPLGVAGKYTPVTVNVANVPASGGYINITPVDDELKTTNLSGGSLLNYYWRVQADGFSTQPNVKYILKYNDADVVAPENEYVPGSVLGVAPFTRTKIDVTSKVNARKNLITYDDGRGDRFPLVEANYTAGQPGRFTGHVEVYYSRDLSREPNWTDGNAWAKSDHLNAALDPHDSRQPAAGDYPKVGDIAIIGWIPWTDTNRPGKQGQPHGMWIDDNAQECAELIFSQMLDAAGEPTPRVYRSNFQFRPTLCINEDGGQLTAGLVRGEGMFWNRQSDPDFSRMDLGEFAQNDSSYIVYENDQDDKVFKNTPGICPNLMVANDDWGRNNRNVTFEKDIITNGNFEILGDANVILDDDADGDLTIGGDLLLFEIKNPVDGSASGGGAQLAFPGNGSNRRVTVNGDLVLSNEGGLINVQSPNTTIQNHELHVRGDILQHTAASGADGLQLWAGNNKDHISLYLDGDADMKMDVTAGDIPNLYRLIINKGTGKNRIAQFNSDFNLNGPTSGAGVAKALELQNGTFRLNHPAIEINLTTGNDPFSIPASAALEVRQGTVKANGNSGIYLDGELLISGGTVDMSGGDNPIVYSASGNATLKIYGGRLTIGSQLRRDTGSEIGILHYTQIGGTVVVGTNAAPVNERGVFEILGTGSAFHHTGGSLHIARAQNAPVVAALYLDPEKHNVRGTTITIGDASTPASQEISIYSTIPLENLEVNNASGQNPSAKLSVIPLNLSKNLTIKTGATFDANGLDLYVGGNFINEGLFKHNNNTTYLNGLSSQTVTGNTTFFNLVKSGMNDLILTASSTELDVDNNFEFTNGNLQTNDNNLYVQGNCVFDGTHVYGGLGEGIIMNGTLAQTLSGGGTLGVLTINNPAGVNVPLGNQLAVNNALRLQEGVFNIDKNLLVLNVNCDIVPVNPFSVINMIQTNISFTDNGVKKYLPSGASSFTYPMGSGGKYTPVAIDVTANENSTGYITVKPANECHPSRKDPDNVLHYHWVLKAGDISKFSAQMRMKYDPADVYVTGSNKIDDYITARLLSDGTGNWNKYRSSADVDVIDVANHELLFDFSMTDNDGISGDYTAGMDEAIPDKVPTFISVKEGNWTNAATWTTYPVAGGDVPAGGPHGSMVIIEHNVTLASDFISSYRTTINDPGKLIVGSTFGHRLGDVFGTGTLSVASGSLPAGVYDDFASASGGTFEFTGTGNYAFLNDITSANNLVLSGTGERRFSNVDLQLLGNLKIDDVKVINEHDRTLSLKKDLIYNGAFFDAGEGTLAKVIFNGDAVQDISGTKSLTGTNGFNHLQVNNPSGITVNTDMGIKGDLFLTSGVVYNTNGHRFVIENPDKNAINNGGVSSHVEGPLFKNINSGDQFAFPVGDKHRFGQLVVSNTHTSGASVWEVQYFNHDPDVDGFSRGSLVNPVKYISSNEYWRVQGPAAATAVLTMRWDNNSGITPNGNFRIVEWANQATPAWREKAINVPVEGTVTLASPMRFNAFANGNFVSFGSTYLGATSWVGNTTEWHLPGNWINGTVPSSGDDVTIPSAPTGGKFPLIDASTQIHNLTLESASNLTIGKGINFTIHGDLNNDGLFLVQTEVGNMTSVITQGDITGSGQEQIDFSFTPRWWWYVGHGVDGVSSSNYFDKIPQSDIYLYEYDASHHKWSQITQDGVAFNKELKGYHMNFKDPTTITYKGHLHNADYTSEPLQAGWQLVANPYVSYVDLQKTDDWTFTNIPKYVYMRARIGTERVAVVYDINHPLASHPDASQYLAPMQAFWVKSEGNGQFGVSKSARMHDPNQNNLKATTVTPDNILRMTLANTHTYDYAAVVFDEEGTEELAVHDAVKYNETGKRVSQLYMLKSDTKTVINMLPEIEQGTDVPLYITVGEEAIGEQSLKMVNIRDFNADLPVVLEDLVTGEKVDLRVMPEYNFKSGAVTDQQRFILHFGIKEDVSTDINNTNEGDVLVYGDQGKVVIDLSENLFDGAEVNVELYTLSGKTVYAGELAGTHMEQRVPRTSAFYIVTLRGDETVISRKVFVK
ncbi:hypothetical protein DMA11_10050 [Marinilabiliaceae bacterium JC017]|nr:hypothetical protein DMA11_10050 [Marinilabiliaceae bacterium JC017]